MKSKEEIAAYKREYHQKNREQLNRKSSERYSANRETYNAARREQYKADGSKQRSYAVDYYRKNSEAVKDYEAKRKRLIRDAFNAAKVGCRCANPSCYWKGDYHPCQLDFHHLDASTKHTNVGTLAGTSLKRLIEEIGKCTMICSNCHRLETFGDLDVSKLPPCDAERFNKLIREYIARVQPRRRKYEG